MLKTIVEKNLFSFHQQFASWEDAITAACQPLVEKKVIEPEYSTYIIHNIKEYGPYIVIAPDVCIPHAQEGKGVNETAIGFMKCETPVDFGPNADYTARLFFVLASTDNEKHLENLSGLVSMLEDESVIEQLVQAKNKKDLEKIYKGLGE